MRILFLIPDLRTGIVARSRERLHHRGGFGSRFGDERGLWTTEVFGGTLNIMRQCALARSLGAAAVMATRSGRDTYRSRGIGQLPFVAWADRRRDDVCIVPDVYSRLADEVVGRVVVYMQHPNLVRPDFVHARPDLRLWTCSPLMSECCRRVLPGKEPTFAPNIVDPESFPLIQQEQRDAGRLAALPRKNGMEFIQAAYRRYRDDGGRYWKLDLIDGVPFSEFAARFRGPQALLVASEIEGCGLPGMEAMAAGIVVIGSNARGASFYMRNRETALVANTPDAAATALRAIEDPQLRQQLSSAGYAFIQRFFPDAQPKRFWEAFLAELEHT
ncbi:MAG: glycosyltransferase [Deltaproteobacteria bacterium]|nr:glycosyltransferase [Deltaproteobacteria bacterium]MBI3390436.1 glycosyltransferase [Deltaproteobacteria bacterium]